MEGSRKRRLLLIMAGALLLSSCAARKVLVLSDPGFDFIAARQMKAYPLRRQLIFRLRGLNPRFLSYPADDSQRDGVESLLASGEYDALVAGHITYRSLSIPDDLNTVVLGGSRELVYPRVGHIRFSAREAMEETGRLLRRQREREEAVPLTIMMRDPVSHEGELEALLRGWGLEEQELILDNLLVLDVREADVRGSLEAFLGSYTLSEGNYSILAYCAPVLQDLLDVLPPVEGLSLILEIPDDDLLPENVLGVIGPDSAGLLRAAARMADKPAAGKSADVELRLKEK